MDLVMPFLPKYFAQSLLASFYEYTADDSQHRVGLCDYKRKATINLCAKLRCVVSFTLRPPYPQENCLRYPLVTKLRIKSLSLSTTTYRRGGSVYSTSAVSRHLLVLVALRQKKRRKLWSKEIVSDPQGSRHGTDRKNPAAYWKQNPDPPTLSQAG